MKAAVVAIGTLVFFGRSGAPAAQPSAAPRTIAVAPLATLGSESSSSEIRTAQALVADGVARLDATQVVAHATMLEAVKKARRPELRSCDGAPACLAQLGKLVGTDWVVYGEVGGLGKSQVIYLKLVEVASAREVRTTVLELGGGGAPEQLARAAAVRLLEPVKYRGQLRIQSNIDGASIFVNGELLARSPAKPMALPVGSHALRITHPEYRDFVRFIDIEFDTDSNVDVTLRPYAAVSGDMGRTGTARPLERPTMRHDVQAKTPWYGRWYTVAGGAALLLVTSAVVVGLATDGVDFDREKTVP